MQWTECASIMYIYIYMAYTYVLLNLRALKIQALYKNRISQCMSTIFCVEFQRYHLKLHTKYLAHTMKDVYFAHGWKFKNS